MTIDVGRKMTDGYVAPINKIDEKDDLPFSDEKTGGRYFMS